MKAKQMKSEERMQVEETAQLFESSLGPLFGIISAANNEHVLGRLSVSLRKALLVMAMQRYSSDPSALCRTLGISRGKAGKGAAALRAAGQTDQGGVGAATFLTPRPGGEEGGGRHLQ